jgi:hypothetical protein
VFAEKAKFYHAKSSGNSAEHKRAIKHNPRLLSLESNSPNGLKTPKEETLVNEPPETLYSSSYSTQTAWPQVTTGQDEELIHASGQPSKGIPLVPIV